MRLIDADALERNVKVIYMEYENVAIPTKTIPISDVYLAPTIDAVPVIRCKDCRYRWDACRCPMYDDSGCYAPQDYSTDDGFCYRGVKKEEEDD